VSMRSGLSPASPSCAESAIEKQPACAAPTSSSGFVPFSFSKRVQNEYAASERTPLAVETVPRPSLRPPCQTAEAFLFISMNRHWQKDRACADAIAEVHWPDEGNPDFGDGRGRADRFRG